MNQFSQPDLFFLRTVKVCQLCFLTAFSPTRRDFTVIAAGHLLLVLLWRHIVLLSLLLDPGLYRALGLSRGVEDTLVLAKVSNATSHIIVQRHRLHLNSRLLHVEVHIHSQICRVQLVVLGWCLIGGNHSEIFKGRQVSCVVVLVLML